MHGVHERELHAQSAGSMQHACFTGGFNTAHAHRSESERGGIVCASRHPPRRLGGVEALRTTCEEDMKDWEDLRLENPPRAAPEELKEEPREDREARNSSRRIQSQLTWHEEQSKGISRVSKSAQRRPKSRPKPPQSVQQAPK